MLPPAPPSSSPLRRLALSGAALLVVLVVLLSCMGDTPTSPKKSGITYASGLRFNTIFPSAFQSSAFADIVTFDRVRVLIRRLDSSVALDTIVNFPANVNEITLELNVPISPGGSSTGEDLMVSLGYLSAANDTVFKGTKQITATPSLPGQPAQAPVTIPVVYTGPGSSATAVRITPRQVSVNGGGPFTFTAVGVDASGATVANTPISWSSADPARATITSASAGSGVALNQRGPARIIASLITGKADTAIVDVNLPPSAIAAVSGSGQVGVIGKTTPRPFAQPLVVKVSASDGVGAAGVTVNFAAATGGGSVSPTSAVTDANGNAQTIWTPGNIVGAQTATASAAGLTGSPVTFTATANQTVATKLAFTTAPTAGANVDAQTSLTLVVAAQDVDGDLVSTFTGPIAISIGAGPNGSTLSGTTTVNAVAGVATFTGLGLAVPGSGYAITAASTGLTSAATPVFNIVNGAPTTLTLVSGGGQTAPASSVLAPVVVQLKDAAGNPTPGVDVTFAVATGGGSVTPLTIRADGSGQASASWTLGAANGTQTLTVTSSGLTPLTVSATATTTSTTNQVAITQSISNTQTAGVTITQPVIAEVRTSAGALLTSYTGTVTVGISINPGGATLSGTTTVNAVGGIATFSNFSLNKAGAGYTLVVSTPGATNGVTAAFTVAPAAPAVLVLQSGGGQSGQPNAALPAAILVRVDDAFGNGVNNVQLNFAVSAGGGSVNPATATTANGGAAFTTWTLGAQGAQTLTVTSPALPNAPLSVSAAFGAGSPATTTVSPQRDTITAFTDTRQITAQGRDAAGNLVAGNWTWTSRTPSVATVSASGVVTAVVDGSTYIVAVEAGGSKDSSLIVVQQRIATVSVNPPTRSIYNGAQFTFTAQAVDGRGVPMVAQPAITWTTSVPSVATVSATGVAAGVGLGSTQIRATSGNAVGVATLTVLTPITRIDVSYDSLNAPAPDVFTMTSLGDTRLYKAVARDTLLNIMPGVAFTWASTNGSVAIIDSTTPFKARALSAANGVTSIQASAQGVTGGATLNVAQVLNSIDLSPATATVAVNGQISMLARGKDANGRFISGGTFTYASSGPTVATVNASGVVTGVANGTTNITALSGVITSNVAVVAVNNAGPAIISFGRDTIGIGRGSTVPIPIYLSKPSVTPVTVNLAVADTFAVWSTASVTVQANQTTVNANLNGRNAGTTKIYAVDGSTNALYAGDTAVLAVQANLRMASPSNSYSLIATDQIATQVLLSDPSPAGGTYVTFAYGTAGRASASPNPAFIPAGQLASNVVITGLAAGSTTITPSASGVTGTAASISVSPSVLNFNATLVRLGAGQQEINNYYIASQSNLNTPLNVALTSLDTSIAVTVPSVTIPVNNLRAFFNPTARATGTTRIVATAPGWTSDTLVVISTTPHVRLVANNGTSLNVTSPAQNATVYAADSLNTIHYRTNSLAVRLRSSDPTVIRVIDTLVTIAPNTQNTTGQIIPGGAGGSAWLYATASGHSPDSVLYTVVGPSLTLINPANRVGVGLYQSVTLRIPNVIASPLVVTLNNSDPTKAGAPATVTIPQGNTQVSFKISGLAVGTSTVIYTAPGYGADTGVTIVNTPRIVLSSTTQLQNYQTTNAYAFMQDSTGVSQNRVAPIVVRFTSTNTQVLTVDSVATVLADAQYNSQSPVIVTAVGVGTAQIIATAPGMTPDTTAWTVQGAKLLVDGPYSFSNYLIGSRQHRQPNEFHVRTPTVRIVAVPVTLTQKNPASLGLVPASFSIPANSNVGNFTIDGLLPGRDTVIASAPGYIADTVVFTVTTPRLDVSALPSTALTTSPPSQVTIYATDSTAASSFNRHFASDTVVIRAVSSDTTVIRPSQTFIRILKGAQSTSASVVYVGPGSAYIVYTDSAASGYRADSTNRVTVTGPSLSVSGPSTPMLGMRQMSSANQYAIQTTNTVTAPLTINLISTDPRVLTVPASLTIPAGQNRVFFTVTAQDTIGTIQIQATATGYGLGTLNVQVTAPQFLITTTVNRTTTSPATAITVTAADAAGTQHVVAQPLTVTLTSSSPGVAAIDSTTVTIPAGSASNAQARWTPGVVGSAQLSASDSRTQAYYRYLTGAITVNVTLPALSATSSTTLGIGQYINQAVSIPNSLSNPLTVSIGHSASPRSNSPPSVVIAANSFQSPAFRLAGTSLGSDTLTLSAPGHSNATTLVNVGIGRIDPLSGWATQLRAGDSTQVTLFTRDPNSSAQFVAAATTFTLAPNANIQFVSGGANSTVITSVVVPADAQFVRFYLKGVSAGAGSASITSPNYTPYSNTLTVTP